MRRRSRRRAAGRRGGRAAADDHAHDQLPPGPIRDRSLLMEGVGKDANAMGTALTAGKSADLELPAKAIASVMNELVTLFAEGSSGHGSRAKPAVWPNRKQLDALATQLETEAEAWPRPRRAAATSRR